MWPASKNGTDVPEGTVLRASRDLSVLVLCHCISVWVLSLPPYPHISRDVCLGKAMLNLIENSGGNAVYY